MKKVCFSIASILIITLGCSQKAELPQANKQHCKDITNVVLNKQSPFCQDYVGRYCATAKDINYDTIFHANFSIDHVGNKCIWHTDAIPNHNFDDNKDEPFPNRVRNQNYVFEMPDKPNFAPTKTPLSLDYYNAILLNGAVVDLLSDGCCCEEYGIEGCGNGITGCSEISNPWRKDPMSPKAGFKPDSHHAHAQEDGTYHYHGPPVALYDTSGKKESPVIGFAADGFPIYGPFINDHGTIRKVRSSYVLIKGKRPADSCPKDTPYDGIFIQDYVYDPVHSGGDLDECNGMVRNGHYGYYVTYTYPYMIKFFKGTPDSSFMKIRH